MKIAYTSDIHIDITENNKKILPYIISYLDSVKPGLFVIAGDASNTLKGLEELFRELSQLSCTSVFVPGNHDLWIESKRKLSKGFDSGYKYEEAIRELCSKYNIIYPVFEPFIYKNLAVAGSAGWYDFSLADERLKTVYSHHDYAYGKFGNKIWNDCRYAVWLENRGASDWRERSRKLRHSQVFTKIFDTLQAVYQKIPDSVQHIIIAAHTAPFTECIVPKELPDPFDAYEGSTRIGDFLLEESKKRRIHYIFGHRHKKLVLRKNENLFLYRSPVGYLEEETYDFDSLVKEKVSLFEI